MVGLTALLIPSIGSARWISGDAEKHLKAMAAACGIPLLWLLWQAALVLFLPRSGALDGVMLSRRMLPPLAGLAAVFLTCVPVLRSLEGAYLRKDELGRSDRLHGGAVMAEGRATEWISGLFRETFSPKK